MKISDKYKTLLSNTGLLLVGTFGSKMISFFMLPFYTNWLSIEDFGTSDIINVYSTILVSIISLCIAEAIFVIPTGRAKEEQKAFFSSSLLFGLGCSVVLFAFYVIINVWGGFSNSSFVSNIGYITLLSVTSIFMSIAQQFCKCINKIRVFAFAGIINTLCVAVLGFIFIKPFGLNGYVASLVIANIIALLYIFFRAKLFEYINIRSISKRHLLELLNYSFPLIPNSIIWLIVSYINRPVLEISLGMASVGLFSLANRFPTLISTIYNNFSNSWQISVLQEFGKKGYESFYNRTCVIVFIIMCICVSLLAIIINPVIHILFNENYYPTIEYIPLLCLSTPFMALASIVGANFSAIKQSKYFFYSSIWSAGCAILLNFVLIPVLGLWGTCFASVMSFAVGALSRIYYSRNIVKLKWHGVYLFFLVATLLTLILHLLNVPVAILVMIFSIEVCVCFLLIRFFLNKVKEK